MEKEVVFKGKLRRGGAEIEANGKATFTAELPALPSDAGTKTYALQSVNGVLTWVVVGA